MSFSLLTWRWGINLNTKAHVQGIFQGGLRDFLHLLWRAEAWLTVFVFIKVSAILLHTDIRSTVYLIQNYLLLVSLCWAFLVICYCEVVVTLSLRGDVNLFFFNNVGCVIFNV